MNWNQIKNPITLGRTLAALYIAIVMAIAFLFIPGRDCTKHFTALRYLGPNTRLAEKVLIKPSDISIEESFWLEQELRALKGKYIKQAVPTSQSLTVDNVRDWPDVNPADAFPVELQAEPDWVFLNQGSFVQVWVSNKPAPERALVLAILPSGSKWVALLRRCDLPKELLAGSKEAHVLRLEIVAGEVAQSMPCTSPSPAQSPPRAAGQSSNSTPR